MFDYSKDGSSGEVELFIDVTQTPGVGKERRFHIAKCTPSFFEDSFKTLAQSQLALSMELVGRAYGSHYPVKNRTVQWYADGYKQLYPKLSTADGRATTRNASVS